jgi:hypothetical protein
MVFEAPLPSKALKFVPPAKLAPPDALKDPG